MRQFPATPLGVCLLGLALLPLCACTQRSLARPTAAQLPVEPTGLRFERMDDAAAFAVEQIEAWTSLGRTLRPVEWAFELCGDDGGFYVCGYHTDFSWNEVRLTVQRDAAATGHTHTPSACGATVGQRPFSSGCRTRGGRFSQSDEGPEGVLRALQQANRLLPHYLLTSSGDLVVWEWSREQRAWVEREVQSRTERTVLRGSAPPTHDHGSDTLARLRAGGRDR